MAAVTRIGDPCSGHGAFPPRPSTSGSGNVFINGIGAVTVGDSYAVHCDPTPTCHPGALAGGSGGVMVNGKALGRIGDPVACGSVVAVGSSNVFAG